MTAGSFGIVKRQVGVGNEVFYSQAVSRSDCYPGTRADKKPMTVDIKTFPEPPQNGVYELRYCARVAAVGQRQDEFVSTQSVDSRLTRSHCGHALGDLLK